MRQKIIWRTGIFIIVFACFAYTSPLLTRGEANIKVSASLPDIPNYIEPKPGAQLVSPYTTIAIRYGVVLNRLTQDLAHFVVKGSKSGEHAGRTILANDQRTIIFIPDQPFQLNEVINVTFNRGLPLTDGYAFHFTTTSSDPATYAKSNLAVSLADEMPVTSSQLSTASSVDSLPVKNTEVNTKTYHTISASFPQIMVTTPANDVDDGYLFLSNVQFALCSVNSHLLILDNVGEPVFYKRMPECIAGNDFTRQANGQLTYFDYGTNIFHALDNTYAEVDTYSAGNGYTTDVHDLQVLPNNHALLMSYDTEVISNKNGIIPNGHITATVTGLIVQEIDAAKNVVFEWRSWDHFQITDTTDIYLNTEPVDYVHGNAIELDTDGNLLLSSRHLNEITKIDRQTGNIIWRLGGKHNQFTFVNESRIFSHQHDMRRLPNGNITFFDNGNFLLPSYSRAVEYQLDEKNKIATLVHEYRDTPDVYSFAMGSTQHLPNNNTLVGWGALSDPAITEFHSDGTKAFELALTAPDVNYRAFRFNWQGYPTTEPTLVVVTDTTPTLYYSWNGATEIASYSVYGGMAAIPTNLINTTLKTGFETKMPVDTALNQFCYFRVMPIDKQGHETRYSNTVFVDTPTCQSKILFLPIEIFN